MFFNKFSRLRKRAAKAQHYEVWERRIFVHNDFRQYEKFGRNIIAESPEQALEKYFKRYKRKYHAEHIEKYWGTYQLNDYVFISPFMVVSLEKVYYYG